MSFIPLRKNIDSKNLCYFFLIFSLPSSLSPPLSVMLIIIVSSVVYR